jgi:hypothetical protein
MVRPALVSTPTPPAAPTAPVAAAIEPLLRSVVIEQFSANTPSAPPAMLPAPVTRIDPPLLKTGPVTPVEIVCGDGAQAAEAAPGSPSAASAANEAPASSADREIPLGLGLVTADWTNFGWQFRRAADARLTA